MSKRFIWVLAVTLLTVVLFTACERSAVAPEPQATPTQGNTGDQTLALLDSIRTQTAAGTVTALVLTTQPGVGSPTASLGPGETPLAATNTPVPSAVLSGAPTPTPGYPGTYTLQQGEFPYCIARRFNVDPAELLALNGLSGGETLQPGLVLNIPRTGNTFPGSRVLTAHPATYTVQADDTIYRIACHYGDLDPIYLAAYNGIAAPYVLRTGVVLNIP